MQLVGLSILPNCTWRTFLARAPNRKGLQIADTDQLNDEATLSFDKDKMDVAKLKGGKSWYFFNHEELSKAGGPAKNRGLHTDLTDV